jgi:hypothetical protein
MEEGQTSGGVLSSQEAVKVVGTVGPKTPRPDLAGTLQEQPEYCSGWECMRLSVVWSPQTAVDTLSSPWVTYGATVPVACAYERWTQCHFLNPKSQRGPPESTWHLAHP